MDVAQDNGDISERLEPRRSDVVSRQLLQEVGDCWQKYRELIEKKEELRKMCLYNDAMAARLKSIKKLQQCNTLETAFVNGEDDVSDLIRKKAKKHHQEQLRLMSLNWWEKLDIYETANNSS